ncbi:hypothetical protein ACVWZV_003380 [Bradyrhizobium sp. GM5.1]
MLFLANPFDNRRRETRLADAWLAGNQHHLAVTGLRIGPTAEQQFDLLVTANERRKGRRVERLEPTLDCTRPYDLIGTNWFRKPLERNFSKIAEVE